MVNVLSQTIPNQCITWQGAHIDLTSLEMQPDFLKFSILTLLSGQLNYMYPPYSLGKIRRQETALC